MKIHVVKMKEFIITKQEEHQRIDKYISKILNKASKSFIYKNFRKKNVKLNNKKITGNEILKDGDIINIYFSDETYHQFSQMTPIKCTNKMTFQIVYEDDYILVCNKPTNLLSQPDGSGDNLVNQIENYLLLKGDYKQAGTGFRPGICNRLDRNTSGIVIAGKTIKALQAFNGAIANKKIDKLYYCIVKGKIVKESKIEGFLLKDTLTNRVKITSNGNHSYIHTEYKPVRTNDNYTMLEVKIITGKSHQIRAHLASIGHPIIGDYKYGDAKINQYFNKQFNLKYQLLHAGKYKFNELEAEFKYLNNKTFTADFSDEFKKIEAFIFE